MSTGTRTQQRTTDIGVLADRILGLRRQPPAHAPLVGISGIDGSGKGWLSDRLAARLEAAGARVAVVHADGWLNLPSVRFSAERPGRHFYENALRLHEMFDSLIVPLVAERSVRLAADYAEETATAFRSETWDYHGIDVILLESIFLFKRAFRTMFDLAIWVDCTFDTALERAIARAQEGLPADETVRAYETIYFPAQRIHLERDEPRTRADIVFSNDARIANSPERRAGVDLRAPAPAPRTTVPLPNSAGTRGIGEVTQWAVPESAMMRRRWDEAAIRLPL